MPKKRVVKKRPPYAELGKYLASVREATKLSQAELANVLKRPQSFVAKTETGRRRLDVIEFITLARAVDVAPERLFAQFIERLSAFDE
jgi:transcriptional regulator with XRE-family HTH domain